MVNGNGQQARRVLRADSLVKRYKKRTVVRGVSIDVRQGEVVGLLGPNGAGKTTTFYMIVGMIRPNEGKVYLDDREITKDRDVQARADGDRLSSAGGVRVQEDVG
jgi:lipopolysaccharide export system ATP-binding protein